MRVQLIEFATARIGPFEAEPPLLDLAHLSVAHWQSASDQRHILHVARVPILFGSGFNDENEPDIFEIGPNRAITGPTGADLKYVEHSGAAMEAGRQDLLDLEARMAVVGADLLLKRPGVMTATQRILDEGAADSQLAAIALEFQDGLERAFGFAARWMGFGGDAGGSLSVNREFGTHLRDPSELDLLLRARLNGDISHETFVRELIRRGVLPEDIDPADEVERAESDMPPRPRDAPVPAH